MQAIKKGWKRSGMSLIELLVGISMLTSLLILTGTTFHLLMRADKSVSQSFVTERSISRLAVQFRDDVHQSASGTIDVDSATAKNELLLGGTEGFRIRYVVTKEGLARLTVNGDSIEAREDYHLPDCRIHFAAGLDTDVRLRMLIIERPGAVVTKNAQAPQPTRSLPIQAYLNRFRSAAPGDAATAPAIEPKPSRETKDEDSQ